MNQVFRPDREQDEIARVHAVVDSRALPDFVTEYEVRLGDFGGDPALWITFKLTGDDSVGLPELTRRADILSKLHDAIQTDWFNEGGDRFPFFRSEYAATAQTG